MHVLLLSGHSLPSIKRGNRAEVIARQMIFKDICDHLYCPYPLPPKKLIKINDLFAVNVAQLAGCLLPTLVDQGSNPLCGSIIVLFNVA